MTSTTAAVSRFFKTKRGCCQHARARHELECFGIQARIVQRTWAQLIVLIETFKPLFRFADTTCTNQTKSKTKLKT
jgi:hypothetical protein